MAIRLGSAAIPCAFGLIHRRMYISRKTWVATDYLAGVPRCPQRREFRGAFPGSGASEGRRAGLIRSRLQKRTGKNQRKFHPPSRSASLSLQLLPCSSTSRALEASPIPCLGSVYRFVTAKERFQKIGPLLFSDEPVPLSRPSSLEPASSDLRSIIARGHRRA